MLELESKVASARQSEARAKETYEALLRAEEDRRGMVEAARNEVHSQLLHAQDFAQQSHGRAIQLEAQVEELQGRIGWLNGEVGRMQDLLTTQLINEVAQAIFTCPMCMEDVSAFRPWLQ